MANFYPQGRDTFGQYCLKMVWKSQTPHPKINELIFVLPLKPLQAFLNLNFRGSNDLINGLGQTLPPQAMMFFMNSPLQALKVKVRVTLFEGSMLLISEAFDHLR